jgi:hypothetical protein
LKRVWAQGDYKNFKVKLGKFAPAQSSTIADTQFSGAEVSFGKNVKAILGAGRISADDFGFKGKMQGSANYQYIGVEGKKNKFNGGLYWHHISTSDLPQLGDYSDDNKEEFNLLSAQAGYRFNKNVAVNGFYAQNRNADNYKKAAGLEVDYKGAQAENQGTWGAWVAYRHFGRNAFVASPWDVINIDNMGQKGWEVGGNYAAFKNTIVTLRYGHGKDLQDEKKVHNLFGRVNFLF